jgi:hypothetical protein
MVHWVTYSQSDNQGLLVLKSSLLAIHALHGRHTGRAIANVVYTLLERAGITSDVCVAVIIPASFH